jgi:hypothetical protein
MMRHDPHHRRAFPASSSGFSRIIVAPDDTAA